MSVESKQTACGTYEFDLIVDKQGSRDEVSVYVRKIDPYGNRTVTESTEWEPVGVVDMYKERSTE